MKKTLLLGIALALVLGVVAQPAEASCNASRRVLSVTAAAQSYLYSPGNPFGPYGVGGCGVGNPGNPSYPCGGTLSYYANGIFWAFGAGDPTYGLGIDSGTFKGQYPIAGPSWLQPSYYGGKALMGGADAGGWLGPGVDGCISDTGSNPDGTDGDECNVVLLTDFDGPSGAFALLSSPPAAAQPADFVYNTDNGFPAAINLAPIPKPTINSSSFNAGVLTLNVTVDIPGGPAGGFYENCQQGQNLAGYRLYVRRFPTQQPKPTSLDSRLIPEPVTGPALPPWEPLTPVIATGERADLDIPCDDGEDLFLCTVLAFNSAPGVAPFETKSCSMNGTRIECGPNMAEPDDTPRIRRELRQPNRRGGARR